MNIYTSDETMIASAQNDVARGEQVWSPLLCGLQCTWRQKRLHETAFYAELCRRKGTPDPGFAKALDRFRFGIYCRDGIVEA